MEIKKVVRMVTGQTEGITFTKENKKILDIKVGDVVEIRKVEKDKE